MILHELAIFSLASCAQFIVLEIGLATLCSSESCTDLFTQQLSIGLVLRKLFAYHVRERFDLGGEACDVRVCSWFAAFLSGCRVGTSFGIRLVGYQLN